MKLSKFLSVGLLSTFLVACSGNADTESEAPKEEKPVKTEEASQKDSVSTDQTITYLGESYTLPAEVKQIVTASLESMEDAAALGVKPAGAITIAGELPEYLAGDLAGAVSIGEKMEPNYETILSLQPDVILGTSKFQEEVAEQLNKIGTMIPVSHISTDWKDNLLLMGQLSGKEAEAEKMINDYEAEASKAKTDMSENLKDENVIVIRVRRGSMFVYPADVYVNPVLYEDLGLQVPDIINATAAQEEISFETLATVNPDMIFLQFEQSENNGDQSALDEILKNPIFNSIDAVKNDKVFVNAVDPMAQGGTAWSKEKFLHAAIEKLTK